jgi:hypothetical protein
MATTFLGIRSLPSRPKDSAGRVAMSWSTSFSTGDPVFFQGAGLNQLGPIPGVPVFAPLVLNLWYSYKLDPVSQQGSYTFGETKSAQLCITRPVPYMVDDTHFYTPGRIVVYVPSTGAIYSHAPKKLSTVSWGATPGNPIETEYSILPLDMSQGMQLQILLQADGYNDGGVIQIVNPASQIAVTLFNFGQPPVVRS